MDVADLKRRAFAARRHWRDCAGYRLQLERPEPMAWQAFLRDVGLEGGESVTGRALETLYREVARRWIRDWQGVTFADLFPVEDLSDAERATAAPCDPDLAERLVLEQPEVGSAAFGAVQELYGARRAAEQAAQKKPSNGSASPNASASSAEPAS